MVEFKKALKEVVGSVSDVEVEIAYAKFIKSRNWDINHPVFEDKKLRNPVPSMDKEGYMQFFKNYNKAVKQYEHLELDLLKG